MQKLETVHLVPLQVVDAIRATLKPADDDGALRQIEVISTQQAMAVDDQADQPIPVTVPVALERSRQLVTKAPDSASTSANAHLNYRKSSRPDYND